MEHKPEYADNDQTIFRKPKDRDHPYVVISKTVFEDAEISWKAKGMMGYLLSRPDDWTVILGDLVKRAPEGRGTVRTILKELEQHGYLLKRTLRDEHGRWAGVEMIVLEHPAPLEQRTYREKNTASKTPCTEKPHTVDPHTDECPLLSTDVLPCTDLTKEEPPLADSPVEDSQDDDPEIAEIAASFKTPSRSHEPQEQRLTRMRDEYGIDPLGVASVVVHHRAAVAHPDGGDASKDGDPWIDRPVREWCVFIGLKYESQSIGFKRDRGEALRRIATTGIMHDTPKTPEDVGAAIRKMAPVHALKWLRSIGHPTHKEFAHTLTNVLCGQVLEENGRASGGRTQQRAEPRIAASTITVGGAI